MNNELYHYGVPGMRWGKRTRADRKYDKAIRKGNKKEADDIAKRAKIYTKKAKQLKSSGKTSNVTLKNGKTVEVYSKMYSRAAKSGRTIVDETRHTLVGTIIAVDVVAAGVGVLTGLGINKLIY